MPESNLRVTVTQPWVFARLSALRVWLVSSWSQPRLVRVTDDRASKAGRGVRRTASVWPSRELGAADPYRREPPVT
jgi:hypothetical protein